EKIKYEKLFHDCSRNKDSLLVSVSAVLTEFERSDNNPVFTNANHNTNIEKHKKNISEQIQQRNDPKYIVYIQYAHNDEKMLAEQLRKKLADNGYVAPAPEKMSNTDFKNSVRYFHSEDADEAKKISQSISSNQINFELQQPKITAPLNQIEIWINTKPADITVKTTAEQRPMLI